MSEPIIVRFLKRNQRPFHRSIAVERLDPGEYQSDYRKFLVRFGSKQRDTGRRMDMGPFGKARMMEYAGQDRNKLEISLEGDHLRTIGATKEQVDEHIRRMRPDVELQRHDAEIVELSRRIKEARDNRLHFLHEAFQRGHKVTVKELIERAEKGHSS
jgi:hypothetical protein